VKLSAPLALLSRRKNLMTTSPYETAGGLIGERMPRLIAKYQTELVAMQAVFTDPLARIAKDRALVEADTAHVNELTAAQERLKLFDEYSVEKELNDAVLKFQEAYGALQDLNDIYAKVVARLTA
jgi:hypothetical protein